MTPLERAKLRIEEDVARRRREQQDRLKGRSTLTHGSQPDAAQQMLLMQMVAEPPAPSHSRCEPTASDSSSSWSSSSSDSCSAYSPSSSD